MNDHDYKKLYDEVHKELVTPSLREKLRLLTMHACDPVAADLATLRSQLTALQAERDELRRHVARHFPARGSELGDMTAEEELMFELCEEAIAWRPHQFQQAELIAAIDALMKFRAGNKPQPIHATVTAHAEIAEQIREQADDLLGLQEVAPPTELLSRICKQAHEWRIRLVNVQLRLDVAEIDDDPTAEIWRRESNRVDRLTTERDAAVRECERLRRLLHEACGVASIANEEVQSAIIATDLARIRSEGGI